MKVTLTVDTDASRDFAAPFIVALLKHAKAAFSEHRTQVQLTIDYGDQEDK